MTSDKASAPSSAQRTLDLLLNGKGCVHLGELRPEEFEKFLGDTLNSVDVRELRRFKPLKSLLEREGTTPQSLSMSPPHRLRMSPDVSVRGGTAYVLGEQFLLVGETAQNYNYTNPITGAKTRKLEEALRLGPATYLEGGEDSVLVLRRPRDRSRPYLNLFLVQVSFGCCNPDASPTEVSYEITQVKVSNILISQFREHFKERYPEVAYYLIWGLVRAYVQTTEELERKLRQVRGNRARLSEIRDFVRF